MSSPAQGGPSVPKEKEKEKKGIGGVLSRVKTVWKNGGRRISTKLNPRSSTFSPTDATILEPIPLKPEPSKPENEATEVPRSQLFAERAKKLGELYGLELKPSEWHSTEGTALRVEKPIRMRVHRKCHVCDTSFGLGKECLKCKHPRCKQCPRVPPKRTEAEKEESRKKRAAILKERAENPPIIPDWDTSDKKIVLRKPAKTGGQDLIHRKPRQRVRRTCCQCTKLYASGTKTCESCSHVRCTDCPRDPSKKDKYPYGYPGDTLGAKVGHYKCHECKTIFSDAPSEDASCPKCKHRNCASCERLTPKKVEPEPDPEVWKSLQAKLDDLKLK
ncbi:hypothetical protein B0H67DRAFT_232411 [Lasiosphaeris hirsuta]|uniref:Uncharacterized protein n=1 Tax=Lasiosphaeris hirsuta TaxID=260670 RepID=A0AA40AFR6_9PEZI|nr:hypothetical protein B0H67DRAFT_232411 [Lasiosphaeris hirsuta]